MWPFVVNNTLNTVVWALILRYTCNNYVNVFSYVLLTTFVCNTFQSLTVICFMKEKVLWCKVTVTYLPTVWKNDTDTPCMHAHIHSTHTSLIFDTPV